MCLQRKKVYGVLRGAVCSISKRLVVHCIATPILPLQRIFPHTMRPKQDRKLHSGLRQGQATRLSARHLVQRPATDWGRHTAAPNALKTGHFKQTFTESSILPTRNDTKKIVVAPPPWPGDTPFGASPSPVRSYSVGPGHFHPRCIENCAFQKTLTDFNILPTRYSTKILHWRLRQGQAMRHSARRPTQRPASHWGRHTASPDAWKTGRCKQTFTDFNVLPSQDDREKKIRRLRQAQATHLSARRPAQRPASHWGRHTTSPDALKTGHCKQTFTEFIVLPTQYDRKKRIGASAKARQRAFRRAARLSVRQGIGGGTLPPPMH